MSGGGIEYGRGVSGGSIEYGGVEAGGRIEPGDRATSGVSGTVHSGKAGDSPVGCELARQSVNIL